MINEELNELYQRDIKNLIKEIGLYASEEDIWKVRSEINNSAGNLCLHLIGSLKHFLGATLGNTGYVRKRENEFSDTGISKAELIKGLEEAASAVELALLNSVAVDMEAQYAFEFFGKKSTRFYMLAFLAHLNYHLGQVNYHRRLILT